MAQTAPNVRRLFGIADDTTAGGTTFDELSPADTIPDADTFYPVTAGNLDLNEVRIDRNAEVRGRRANTKPLPFQLAPVATVPVNAYRTIVEKMLKKCLGGDDNVDPGSGTGAQTHQIDVLGFGSTALPSCHVQIVRDDLNQKMSGCAVNRLTLDFPMDGQGTAEMEFWGMYLKHDSGTPPDSDFSDLDENPFMLRDADFFIDGATNPLLGLAGFQFVFNNNLRREFYTNHNVVTRTIGTPTQTLKIWYPGENRIGAAPDITYRIMFDRTHVDQEVAFEYSQAQAFVFECAADPLSTSPAATALLRITIDVGVHTGGGPDALSAREDLHASYDGSAFWSETDSEDIVVEIVNGDTADIT